MQPTTVVKTTNAEQETKIISDDYVINLEINPEQRLITGNQDVKYTNKSNTALKVLYLNVYGNGINKEMLTKPFFDEEKSQIFYEKQDYGFLKINDLTINGEKYNYELNNKVLKIDLAKPLEINESIEISFKLEGYVPKLKYDFGGDDNSIRVSNFLPTIAPFYNNKWHIDNLTPVGDAFLSVPSNYILNIKIPNDYSIIGTKLETQIEGDNNNLYTYKENLIRDFNFIVYKKDNYKIETFTTDQNTDINIFYDIRKVKEEAVITNLYLHATRVLEFYNENIGTYAYGDLNIYLIDYFRPKGFYSSASIYLDTNTIINNFNPYEFSTLIGKQWFGDIVKNHDLANSWTHEGLTNFLTYLIIYDDDILESKIKILEQNVASKISALKFDNLQNDITFYSSLDEYNILQVDKATLLFYELYNKIGKEQFQSFLKEYYNNYSFKFAGFNELKQSVEKVYGHSLTYFFDDWLILKPKPVIQKETPEENLKSTQIQ